MRAAGKFGIRKYLRIIPVLLLLLALLGCKVHWAPAPLQGMWHTDTPKYASNFVRFDEDYIVIGLGEDITPKAERIIKIVAVPIAGSTHYDIESVDDKGIHNVLHFLYTPANGGEIRLSNPRHVIWRKGEINP